MLSILPLSLIEYNDGFGSWLVTRPYRMVFFY